MADRRAGGRRSGASIAVTPTRRRRARARVCKKVDPAGGRNLMRLTLHPKGLQPWVVDRPGTATALLMRLQAEVQANPANTGLQELLADLRALPGVPSTGHPPGP